MILAHSERAKKSNNPMHICSGPVCRQTHRRKVVFSTWLMGLIYHSTFSSGNRDQEKEAGNFYWPLTPPRLLRLLKAPFKCKYLNINRRKCHWCTQHRGGFIRKWITNLLRVFSCPTPSLLLHQNCYQEKLLKILGKPKMYLNILPLSCWDLVPESVCE